MEYRKENEESSSQLQLFTACICCVCLAKCRQNVCIFLRAQIKTQTPFLREHKSPKKERIFLLLRLAVYLPYHPHTQVWMPLSLLSQPRQCFDRPFHPFHSLTSNGPDPRHRPISRAGIPVENVVADEDGIFKDQRCDGHRGLESLRLYLLA